MTITEFLLARVAEDEASALGARTPYATWVYLPARLNSLTNETHHEVGACDPRIPEGGTIPSVMRGPWASEAQARHIARHDPNRVLAECESKRRIIALHSGEADYRCQSGNWADEPCDTIKALALPYADHPDYDEAWRLDTPE